MGKRFPHISLTLNCCRFVGRPIDCCVRVHTPRRMKEGAHVRCKLICSSDFLSMVITTATSNYHLVATTTTTTTTTTSPSLSNALKHTICSQ